MQIISSLCADKGLFSVVIVQLGEHKETMGIYCSHILADYLNVISGYGSTGVGLHRSVLLYTTNCTRRCMHSLHVKHNH